MPYIGNVSAYDSVGTLQIEDGAVTADKLANSINTAIAANTAKTGITAGQTSSITANTAKVTNATHTGDVTGGTALTIAADAVTTAKIANNAITTAKIPDGAITQAKIDPTVALGGPSLGTNSVIRTNAKTISENITFLGSENGLTVGPITINSGYTVTVASGSTWVIL